MTYAAFIALVNEHLDVDANRRGTETLRASMIKAAFADLKHHVACYQDRVTSYGSDDEVPFDAAAAEAVAYYVKARIVRAIDRDLAMSQAFMADYMNTRRRLVRVCNEFMETPHSDTVVFNFELAQGASLARQLEWLVGEPLEPVNFTGYSGRMAILGCGGILVLLTTDNGRMTLGADGTVNISLPPEVTATMPPGKWAYELDVFIGTYSRRLLVGTITVTPSVNE